jgi:hypothetical protein
MMTPSRRALLSGLFLLLIGGQVFDVVFKREDWPFSSYPMYSEARSAVVVREDLTGVSAGGEFPLTAYRHFAPLDDARFRRALKRVAMAKDGGARRGAVIETLFRRYETLRAAGVHDDPDLLGVRGYSVEWDILSGAVNRGTPDRRKLHLYVYRPPAELRSRLVRAATGELSTPERDARRLVSEADMVVDAAKLSLEGDGERMADRDAASGVALRLDARARGGSDAGPEAHAEVEIAVARGHYSLWLRGKVPAGGDTGALSVTAIAGAELHCWSSAIGMGNWQDAFPAGAFAWSSSAPGAPPCTLEATGRPVRLRVSPQAGRVLLDQIWLASEQAEQPQFAEAVALAPPHAAEASR